MSDEYHEDFILLTLLRFRLLGQRDHFRSFKYICHRHIKVSPPLGIMDTIEVIGCQYLLSLFLIVEHIFTLFISTKNKE